LVALLLTLQTVEEELSASPWAGLILAAMKVCFAVGNITSVVNIKKNGKKSPPKKQKQISWICFYFTKGEDTNANKPSFYEGTEQQIGRQEHNSLIWESGATVSTRIHPK
ncbi:hypothetical protein AMECASPLE_028498, partial [Ameca splendens]